MYPCGVLILMGWVDEWVSKHPGRIKATYPRDDLVEQMLQHVDVLQKLGLPARKNVDHSDVKRWHYFHGKNADATPMEPFMLELQKILGEEQQLGLGNCVTEAMINVGHHAYKFENGGPWWIFATITQKQVFVAIYDRGDSVPGTLLAKPQLKDFLNAKVWIQGRGDGNLITSAVGEGREHSCHIEVRAYLRLFKNGQKLIPIVNWVFLAEAVFLDMMSMKHQGD